MHFKIDWARLMVGRKFTIFALFLFEGNFQVQAPSGVYIWRSNLMKGFLHYEFGGAYICRGLYMEGLIFGILRYSISTCHHHHHYQDSLS